MNVLTLLVYSYQLSDKMVQLESKPDDIAMTHIKACLEEHKKVSFS